MKHNQKDIVIDCTRKLCAVIETMRETGQDQNLLMGQFLHAHEESKLALKRLDVSEPMLLKLKRGTDLLKSKQKAS